eukprot:SM000035S13120  [mRNA]  locus=s35:511110:515553:- [translate_table: standard]
MGRRTTRILAQGPAVALPPTLSAVAPTVGGGGAQPAPSPPASDTFPPPASPPLAQAPAPSPPADSAPPPAALPSPPPPVALAPSPPPPLAAAPAPAQAASPPPPPKAPAGAPPPAVAPSAGTPPVVLPSPPLAQAPTPPPPVTKAPPSPPPPGARTPSPPPVSDGFLSSPPPPPGITNSPPPPRAASSPPPPGATASPPFVASPPPRSVLYPPPPGSAGGGGVSKSGGGGIGTGAVIGIAAGGALAGLVLLVVLLLCCFKRKKKGPKDGQQKLNTPLKGAGAFTATNAADSPRSPASYYAAMPPGKKVSPPVTGTGTGSPRTRVPPAASAGSRGSSLGNSRSYFSYEELEEATNGFAEENVLGQGGFGRVYKGVLRDGKLIAVKQLTLGGGQGEREFQAEVEIISRVHHRHLVTLLGYCIANEQRLLVYDYVPNGTIEYNLHGRLQGPMSWDMRMKAAVGAAKGLAYLHEDCHPRIIHRDIKSSNILLDKMDEAQVADFGLAKLAEDTFSHVSTRVMGTFGYLAPEYAMSGKLTDKSDVYSFGVVLLELITGKRPVDPNGAPGQESLVEWARPFLARDDVERLIDPQLQGLYNDEEMDRMISTAAQCVRHSAAIRPRMSQVVRLLQGEQDINEMGKGPNRPGYSTAYDDVPFGGNDTYDSAQYSAEMRQQYEARENSVPVSSLDTANHMDHSGQQNSHGSLPPSSAGLLGQPSPQADARSSSFGQRSSGGQQYSPGSGREQSPGSRPYGGSQRRFFGAASGTVDTEEFVARPPPPPPGSGSAQRPANDGWGRAR